MNTLELKINDIELKRFKLVKQAMNGNVTEEVVELAKYFFNEQPQGIMKKFKKKHISEFVNDSKKMYELVKLQNVYIHFTIKKERERAWKFLNNKKEAEKAGFVDENEYKKLGKKIPKQSLEQSMAWAEKAYPKLELDKWENELNKTLFQLVIK